MIWGRPVGETLFFKGAQETRKQGRLLYEPETPKDEAIMVKSLG